MTRIVLSELLKFRTTRTFWALAGSAVGLVLLIVILTLAIDDNLSSEHDVRSLLSSTGIYGLLTLVLGVVAGAGEYRHGTIAWTLLVTPNRLRAVGGSVIACFLGGLAIGVVVVGLHGGDRPSMAQLEGRRHALRRATRSRSSSAASSTARSPRALGSAFGALLRNQVGGRGDRARPDLRGRSGDRRAARGRRPVHAHRASASR